MASGHDRSDYTEEYFEDLFDQPDPWHFLTSEYEKARYVDLIAAVPEPLAGKRVLEFGCAEGAFTELVASEWPASLLAIDISPTAIDRAKHRCSNFTDVQFMQMDMMDRLQLEPHEVVFCAEVLTYARPKALESVCQDVVACVAEGGYLLMTHHTAKVRPVTGAMVRRVFDISELLEPICAHRRKIEPHEYELAVYRRR